MNMGRAYCNLGLAHLALGQLETSLECQKYFLAIAHMTHHTPGEYLKNIIENNTKYYFKYDIIFLCKMLDP